MFNLYRSNRAEVLVDALVRRLDQMGRSPFDESLIAVPSPAYAEWLSACIAERLGIACGFRFMLPRAVIEKLLNDALGTHGFDLSPFRRESMQWSIMAELGGGGQCAGLESVAHYLKEDPGQRKLVQLSSKLAGLFDDYVIYRPEMVLSWQDEKVEDWQGQLFRQLIQRFGERHLAQLAYRFEMASEGDLRRETLPASVALIGVSSVPPLFLTVLRRLSRLMDVDLYVTSPTALYFADLKSPKEIARVTSRVGGTQDGDHYFTSGHSLLASFGQVGRDFQGVLEEIDYAEPFGEQMVDPRSDGRATTLRNLQAELIAGQQGPEDMGDVLALDDSIVLRGATTSQRELEVLRDRLQSLFEADPSLMPHDVLVVAPDIEQYADLIDSVFGDEDDRPRLPYRVVRRGGGVVDPVVQGLTGVLRLIGGRYGGPEVLDCMSLDIIAARFGLADEDIATAYDWVNQTGIRWGLSREDRSRRGHAAYGENTWAFGLRRLLVGYALPGDGETLFEGVLPSEQIRGSDDTRVLGGLVGLIELLEQCSVEVGRQKMASEWCTFALSLVDRLVPFDSQYARQASGIKKSLRDLNDDILRSRSNPRLSFDVFRGIALDQIQGGLRGAGYSDGSILFGDLVPFHGIPARVVCLLGMNDGDFPRASGYASFDLIARSRRPGDRTVRGDDHYMFLEALLAARDVFYISYRSGEGPNSACAPSPLLSEFAAHFTGPGQDVSSVIEQLPATSSHPDHFDPSFANLWSYSVKNCAVAEVVGGGGVSREPFWTEFQVPAPEPNSEILLDDLLRFYRSPSAYLLKRGLKMDLPFLEEVLDEWEPGEVDYLERFQTGAFLVDRRLSGLDRLELYPILKAAGVLPLGESGRARFDSMFEKTSELLQRLQHEIAGEQRCEIPVDICVGDERIIGTIEHSYSFGAVHYRYGRIRPVDRLSSWLVHLVGSLVGENGTWRRSVFLGNPDKDWRYELGPVPRAAEQLALLVKHYRLGCRQPLPFFPSASYLYAKALVGSGEADDENVRRKALQKARADFYGDGLAGAGEAHEPAVRQLYADGDPLAENLDLSESSYEELARALMIPMIECEVLR